MALAFPAIALADDGEAAPDVAGAAAAAGAAAVAAAAGRARGRPRQPTDDPGPFDGDPRLQKNEANAKSQNSAYDPGNSNMGGGGGESG